MSKLNAGPIGNARPSNAGDLDQLTSCPCGCEETELRPSCHPKAFCRTVYDRREKIILLVCSYCSTFCAKIKVAPGLPAAAKATHGGAHVGESPSIN